MPPRELLRLLVLAQVLRAEIKRVDDLRRAGLTGAEGLDAGDRLEVRVPGPDGRPAKIGTVRVDPGTVKAEVTNERVLLEWVREHYPSEVTETVREKFVERLKERAAQHGEVIPGVEVTEGEPRVVVTKEKNATALVAAVYQRGELPELLGVLGLEAGSSASGESPN